MEPSQDGHTFFFFGFESHTFLLCREWVNHILISGEYLQVLCLSSLNKVYFGMVTYPKSEEAKESSSRKVKSQN